jgi:glutamate synthase (NADPH/NADH) small chain
VLVRAGVKSIVFDKYSEMDGLLTFGIPEFKLERSVLSRRREVFEGIEFKINIEVRIDVTMVQLMG